MWHAFTAEQAASKLDADPRLGLTPEEAANRLRRNGPNTVATQPSEPWWKELLESLREPLQLLLIAVGAIYFLLGEWADALTIVAVVLVVSGMEAGNELRARNAVAALSSLGAPMASVVRAGLAAEIPSADVVAGDVVLLGPGHRVPADLRLVETTALRIDESSLTGESAPVAKDAQTLLPAEIDLAERRCMAYAGTLVTAGKGRGLAVATGSASEIGRIAELTRQAREPRTPLQQAMRDLSGWLLWVALGFSVLVPALGVVVAHLAPQAMLLTGLSLAFAVIPEELPILITGVLGLGAYRLARQHAIVRHLRAAETLGSVSVVATDKTGTLTQNRMRLVEVLADGHGQSVAQAMGSQLGRDVVEAGVVANDAQVAGGDGRAEPVGDPTEVALLVEDQEAGLDLQALRASCNVVEEHPFDAQRKRMSVVCERDRDGARFVVVKGAVESVLAVCVARRQAGGADEPLDEARRAAIQASVEAMAVRGLRVLALAQRRLEATEAVDEATEQVERALVLLGVVGLEDPPRPEAASTVGTLRSAGVRVLMLTGDHPATARAIAERVGIPNGDVVRGRDLDLLSDEALAAVA
ncbi:MAG TPA: cation-transporting P-type ATPase, partial [Chloroflexota bacterium]